MSGPPAPPAATPGQAVPSVQEMARVLRQVHDDAAAGILGVRPDEAWLAVARAAEDAAMLAGMVITEALAFERDTARDALGKILRGLSSGEGQPLTDDEIIAIARGVLGGDHA